MSVERRIPKRFALSTLLLLMLVVALVFGYAQWRKQWIISEIEKLRAEGVVYLTMRDGWLQPTIDHEVRVFMAYCETKGFSYKGNSYTSDEAGNRFRTLTDRLHAIGVDRVSWWLVLPPDPHGNELLEIHVSEKDR